MLWVTGEETAAMKEVHALTDQARIASAVETFK
jgi:hypothetical protein